MEGHELSKFFFAGITLGWGPCLAICLPVLFPYITAKGINWQTGLKLTLIFSFARLSAYSLLGLTAVAAFRTIDSLIGPNTVIVKLAAGSFIVFTGLAYLLGKIPHASCRFLDKFLVEKSNWNMFILGFLIGLAPCPPLVAILTYIGCMSGNILDGGASGFSFGAGTLISPLIPIGTIAGLISHKIKDKPKIFITTRIICGLIIIYFGIKLTVS
ncbi:MAG: sulfite exporter TauE/SafE family protein [Elusimicrobiota bacterium]